MRHSWCGFLSKETNLLLKEILSRRAPVWVASARAIVTVLLAAMVVSSAAHGQEEYELAIQKTLADIYSQRPMNPDEWVQNVYTDLTKLDELKPGFPAPAVYRELLDSWMSADNPGNPELLKTFQQDSAEAIRRCNSWIVSHPKDPDGWRYLASAYGQVSQYYVTVERDAWKSVRNGKEMYSAIKNARANERIGEEDPDTALGFGSYDYFTGRAPLFIRSIAWFLGGSGDAQRGLVEIKSVVAHGRHMKMEAAMVLAATYWSEGQYGQFADTIETYIAAKYPMLLPARTWEVSGFICAGSLDEARDLVHRIPAPPYWLDFQLGRIELARQDSEGAKAALDLFNRSIQESGPNGSIITWDYVGRDSALARLGLAKQEWGHDARVEPQAISLAKSMFRGHGQCAH